MANTDGWDRKPAMSGAGITSDKGYNPPMANIKSQSVTDQDAQRSIGVLNAPSQHMEQFFLDADMCNALGLAITALRQMRTEPCCICNGKAIGDITYSDGDVVREAVNCPNCGRKLTEVE